MRLVLFIIFAAFAGGAAAADLKLVALDGTVRMVSEAELKAMPRVALKLDSQEIAPFEGVLVKDILAKTGLADASDVRGPALAVVMVFRATDGYVVALPLAELNPDFRRGRIVLADSWNAKPLPTDEAPFHLIVEGDGRPARSIHSLTTIELKSLR